MLKHALIYVAFLLLCKTNLIQTQPSVTTDGTSNQQSTSPPNAQPELSISPLVNVFVQGGAPILIIDPDTIQVRDVDSSLFSELLIYITNPQDGSNNEIIEFSRQLPASALSVGPSLTTGGEILYRVTFLNGGANADRVTEAISVIRYNNLRAAASITVSPPRIICLTIEDFETASDRACVIVTISPPNLFDPVFVMDSVSASVTERNQQIFIATLTATDSDTGPQATIAYSITQVISYFMNTPLFTSDIFTIGSSNGNITAPNGLDTESYMRHTITVRASDMGNPVRSATATVTVNVLDANDVAPSFTGTPYIAGSQREELAPPRFVFLVTAVDLDVTAPNNIIQSYGLENYQTLFTIDSTGVITLIAPLDAEVQDEFMINVSAVDRGTPPQTGYTTVQFRLIDFNDNAARIAQVSAATFVIGDGPTSIGPALVIDDPDIGPSAINYISVTLTSNPTDARLTIDLCFCQCQDDRLADAAFSQQAINLLNLATFQQDQPETSGAVNFYPVPFGIGRCRAWELRRGITSQNDGYGRIPRSSLPSNFAVGDFSFSFALAQTDEGYLISIPDQTNPNLPTASVNRQFAIWIRRYDFRFYYTTNSIIGDDNPAVLRLNQHTILQEFFEPFSNSPMVHHFTIIVNSSPPIVDIYVDCRLLGSLVLTGPVMTPSNNIDVFIGQSRPRVTNGGRLAGVVSEFYYYPRALTYSEVQNICNCGEETIDLPPVLPTNVTTAITTNTAESEPIYILVIEPTSGVIPVDNAVSILRGITYTNTFNFPDIRIDRELTFVVREETGVEETTFGYIRLIANGFSQTSVSDFQNFICNLSQAVILPSTSVVESHGSTIQPSTTEFATIAFTSTMRGKPPTMSTTTVYTKSSQLEVIPSTPIPTSRTTLSSTTKSTSTAQSGLMPQLHTSEPGTNVIFSLRSINPVSDSVSIILFTRATESGSYSSMDLVNYIASATIDGVNPYTPRIIESDNISSKKPMHTSTTTFTQATEGAPSSPSPATPTNTIIIIALVVMVAVNVLVIGVIVATFSLRKCSKKKTTEAASPAPTSRPPAPSVSAHPLIHSNTNGMRDQDNMNMIPLRPSPAYWRSYLRQPTPSDGPRELSTTMSHPLNTSRNHNNISHGLLQEGSIIANPTALLAQRQNVQRLHHQGHHTEDGTGGSYVSVDTPESARRANADSTGGTYVSINEGTGGTYVSIVDDTTGESYVDVGSDRSEGHVYEEIPT